MNQVRFRPIFSIALILFTFWAIGVQAQMQTPPITIFTNVDVFDGSSDELLRDTDVLVEGNVIGEVGTGLAASGARVIDGGGRTLMPGLIDAHTHIMLNENPLRVIASMDEYEIGARAAKRVETYLSMGFTSIRDIGGDCFGVKAAVDAGVIDGPRIFCAGSAISQTAGHGDFRMPLEGSTYFDGADRGGRVERMGFMLLADGVAEVQKAVREQLRLGASHIKVMAGGGVTSLVDPLDATQYTPEEMRAAVAEATRYGTYVAVHAHTDDAINHALDAGVLSIEHGPLIEEDTVRRMARMGAYLSPQAFIAMQEPGANPSLRDPVQMEKMRRVGAGIENELRWAQEHGVTVLWGTDLFGNEALILNVPMEFAARSGFFSATEQLQQVTGNNGEILARSGLKHPYPGAELGVIQPGAYADLILVNGDPTEDIMIMTTPAENIALIMKNGKIYKDTL